MIDALLGTGLTGPATGRMLEGIREINGGFPLAKVVAVDIPSGMPSDSGEPDGEFARADATVTFTAPEDRARAAAELRHVWANWWSDAIGSPAALYATCGLSLVEPAMFRAAAGAAPAQSGHKGTFGHVLVVGGLAGEDRRGRDGGDGGAARRRGAGHGGVGRARIAEIAAHAPELMTAPSDYGLTSMSPKARP